MSRTYRQVIRFSKNTFLFLLFSSSIYAQHLDSGFDAGVKGGFPFTDFVSAAVNGTLTTNIGRSSDYIVGPVAEVRIPFGFAVEVDALYRNSDYHVTTTSGGITSTYDANAHSWEIPYLAKF